MTPQSKVDPMPKTSSSDSDHDLLIRIDSRVELLQKQFTDHFANTTHNIGSIDTRIRKIEDLAIQYPAATLIIKYDKMLHEWEQFKTRWKSYAAIGGVFLALLIVALNQVVRLWIDRNL